MQDPRNSDDVKAMIAAEWHQHAHTWETMIDTHIAGKLSSLTQQMTAQSSEQTSQKELLDILQLQQQGISGKIETMKGMIENVSTIQQDIASMKIQHTASLESVKEDVITNMNTALATHMATM